MTNEGNCPEWAKLVDGKCTDKSATCKFKQKKVKL